MDLLALVKRPNCGKNKPGANLLIAAVGYSGVTRICANWCTPCGHEI